MNRILKALRDSRKVLELQEEEFREEASFYRQQTKALKEETEALKQQTNVMKSEMKEIDYTNAWRAMNDLQEHSHQLDTIKELVKQLENVILRKAEIHSDSSVCYSLTQVIQLMIDSYVEEWDVKFDKAWEATITQIHKQNVDQAAQDLQELVEDPSVLIGLE